MINYREKAAILHEHMAGRHWIKVKEVRKFFREHWEVRRSLTPNERDRIKRHLGLVSLVARSRSYWVDPRYIAEFEKVVARRE